MLYFSKYYFICTYSGLKYRVCVNLNKTGPVIFTLGLVLLGTSKRIFQSKTQRQFFLRKLNFLHLVGGYNGIGDRVNNSYTPIVNRYVQYVQMTLLPAVSTLLSLIGETISLIIS